MAFQEIYDLPSYKIRYEYKENANLINLINVAIAKNPTTKEYDAFIKFLLNGKSRSILSSRNSISDEIITTLITHHTPSDSNIIKILECQALNNRKPQYPWMDHFIANKQYEPSQEVINILLKCKYHGVDTFITDTFTLQFLKTMFESIDLLAFLFPDFKTNDKYYTIEKCPFKMENIIQKCIKYNVVPDDDFALFLKKSIAEASYGFPSDKKMDAVPLCIKFLHDLGYVFSQNVMLEFYIHISQYIQYHSSNVGYECFKSVVKEFEKYELMFELPLLHHSRLLIGMIQEKVLTKHVYNNSTKKQFVYDTQILNPHKSYNTKVDEVDDISDDDDKKQVLYPNSNFDESSDYILSFLYNGDIDSELMEMACAFNNPAVFQLTVNKNVVPTHKCMIYACITDDTGNVIKSLINMKATPQKEHLFYLSHKSYISLLVENGLQLDEDMLKHIMLIDPEGNKFNVEDYVNTRDIKLSAPLKYPAKQTENKKTTKTSKQSIKAIDYTSQKQKLELLNGYDYALIHFHNINITLDDIINITKSNKRLYWYNLYQRGLLNYMGELPIEKANEKVEKAEPVKGKPKKVIGKTSDTTNASIVVKTKNNVKYVDF